MKRTGLTRRVWPATLGLAIVLTGLATLCTLLAVDVQRASIRADRQLQLDNAYQRALAAVNAEQIAVRQFARHAEILYLAGYGGARADLRAATDQLRRDGTNADRALASYIHIEERRYGKVVDQIIAVVNARDLERAIAIETEQARPVFDDLQRLVNAAANGHRARASNELRKLRTRNDRAVIIIPTAFAAGVALLAVCWTIMIKLQRDLRRGAAAERHRADHDPLTGLANRSGFHTRFEHDLERNRVGAVLVLDLNRFKQVNDVHGHHCGDQLLQQVAARLATNLDSNDLAARLGGDEFAVLLTQIGAEHVDAVVSRLAERLTRPYKLDGTTPELTIGVSIGAAIVGHDGDDPETLLKEADRQMYERKPGHPGR